MKRISSALQKGGVGKTTTSINLAYYLNHLISISKNQQRVLVIDFDPQGNFTRSVIAPDSNQAVDAYSLFEDEYNFELNPPCKTILEHVDIIPAGDRLFDIESKDLNVVTNPAKHIENMNYDYVVIDTPPSLGRLSIAAIVASDFVYSPIVMDDFSFEGLEKFLETFGGLKESFNPNVNFIGVIPNLLNLKDEEQVRLLAEVKQNWGELVFENHLKSSSAIPKAIRSKKAIWDKPNNGNTAKVGKAVMDVSREIVSRCIFK